jgi:predicted double-glycine peptidase
VTLAVVSAGVIGVGLADTSPGAGGEVTLPGGPGNFTVPVRSMPETKFLDVIRQEYDFSCGSAALASLLTYHYERPTSEQEVFKTMWLNGEQAKISKFGFSLLDMKNYLATRGLAADGFRVPLDKLAVAKVPAIVLVDTGGYKHFVIIKGLSKTDVLVGDPALGTRTLPRAQFEAMWNGILFVLHSEGEVGQRHFNQAEDWGVIAKAPLQEARIRDSLASFTLNLPGVMREF